MSEGLLPLAPPLPSALRAVSTQAAFRNRWDSSHTDILPTLAGDTGRCDVTFLVDVLPVSNQLLRSSPPPVPPLPLIPPTVTDG